MLIDDRYSSQTRRMLTLSQWETRDEGQALIDMYARRVA